MKVVLKQDVKNIGKKDGMYEVSDGYARNFLFPRKLAVPADAAAVNEVKSKAAAQEHHRAEQQNDQNGQEKHGELFAWRHGSTSFRFGPIIS